MGRPTMYWSEVRERAVGMVSEHRVEYPCWVGGDLFDHGSCSGVGRRRCCRWVRQAERGQGVRVGLTSDQMAELVELRRECRELRRANEILRKASAYFALAELDRRPRR